MLVPSFLAPSCSPLNFLRNPPTLPTDRPHLYLRRGATCSVDLDRHVRIILVEPQGPINVGAIARLMKNFAVSQLYAVNPQCDPFGDTAKLFATPQAHELLGSIKIVDSVDEALGETSLVVATTARFRDAKETATQRFANPREMAASVVKNTTNGLDSAILFGPEPRGLSNEEMKRANILVNIPSNPSNPVVNLSHAVSIIMYEVFNEAFGERAEQEANRSRLTDSPTAIERAQFVDHLQEMLQDIDYFTTERSVGSAMHNLNTLVNRLPLMTSDLRLLRGIIRKVSNACKARGAAPDSKNLHE